MWFCPTRKLDIDPESTVRRCGVEPHVSAWRGMTQMRIKCCGVAFSSLEQIHHLCKETGIEFLKFIEYFIGLIAVTISLRILFC